MKKIWSIVLAVVMVAMTLTTVPVFAAGVTEDDIKISTNIYDVTCTVETTTSGTMTALLTNKFGGEVSGQLHGIKSNRKPEVITDATGAIIGYKYVFNFNMAETAPTENYVVSIGYKGATTKKEFAYASLNDKVLFYDALKTKASDEIKEYFEAYPLLVPVDLKLYNTLAGDVYNKVNAQIAALDLETGVTEGDDTATKIAKLKPVDSLFTTRFEELMTVADIVTADVTKWDSLVARLMGDGTFDSYYYNEANVDTAVITPDEVLGDFKTEAAAMSDYTISEAAATFDKATLTFIEKSRSVGVLKDAFVKFATKGTITPDMTNINALISKGVDANLWSDLRVADNTDCAALISNAVSIARTMVVNGALNGVDGGVTGGATGGTTGGTVIDKPTGGGGGGGMAANAPKTEKPADTETPEVPEGTFSDISNVDWAKEAIETLADKGVLNGKGDGKFAPNDNVTREEFVKIIVVAFDLEDAEASSDFADVSKDSWSYSFVASAAKLGIVSGDGASFNPTSGISRQDMAVIIHRVFEHLGAEIKGDAVSFDDDAEISEYAKAAVEALTAAGIINGMGDGTFAPSGTVTRAQAAKVVYGLLNLVGGGK